MAARILPMAQPEAPDPIEASRMSLGDHLDELRQRLIKGLLIILAVFLVAYGFGEQSKRLVNRPLEFAVTKLNRDLFEIRERQLAADPNLPRDTYFRTLSNGQEVLIDPVLVGWQLTDIGEDFLTKLKAWTFLALLGGGPFLLWQLWGFIAAGLYPNERRAVLTYFPASVVLFLVGVLFGYLLMVPYGIYFLNSGALQDSLPQFKASSYFSFLMTLCIGLGLVFQLPVIMTAITRVGLVEVQTLRNYRRHFILGAFVVAAVLTPPDPYTQTMMAIPMCLLFEVGLWTSTLVKRRSEARQPAPAGGQ
jgi:sec-independent protein translocase protein TatC